MDQAQTDLWSSVIAYMAGQGWRAIPAKSRDFEQSLFDHCLLEVDVFLQMTQVLGGPHHWNLTDREQEIVTVALMAHDYGKTRPEWQDYLHERGPWVSDVNRRLTSEAVARLYPALGLGSAPPQVEHVLENCINLHMGHERTAANVVSAILKPTGGATERWWFLADLVYHIDNLCSIRDFLSALDYLRKPETPFGKQLHAAHHQVTLRGVSTVMLHEAAQSAFVEHGWSPLLFYRDATIYVRSRAGDVELPLAEVIQTALVRAIGDSFGTNIAELIVGNPTASMLPKPELFDPSETRDYLAVAGRRIGRQSFLKKPLENRGVSKGRRQVVAEYLRVAPSDLDARTVEEQSARISEAQPEMVVFKFFKAITSSEFIGSAGAQLAAALYDDWLGPAAWSELQGMSTLMPARDMRHVDRFWSLGGVEQGLPIAKVRELPAERRMTLLVESLTRMTEQVYAALPAPPSRKTLAAGMAAAFMDDLIVPSPQADPARLAQDQQEAYSRSKPFMGGTGRNARYLCAICNTPFVNGTESRADFLDKPESHTNRAVSHGRFGKLVICDACKYERMLRQLLLNGRAEDLLVLIPRRLIGRGGGDLLMAKARDFAGTLQAAMTGQGSDPNIRASFGLTAQIARKTTADPGRLFGLPAAEAAEMFSYRASEENRRKRRRELEKALKDEYAGDLAEANTEWNTDFEDWEAAVDAVVENRVRDATDIRAVVYGLKPRLKLICRTPNLLLMPLADPVSMGNESETDAALRKVFVELGLALAFDCAVAIVGDSEPLAIPEPGGLAWVPPVGLARRLLGRLLLRLDRRAGAPAPGQSSDRAQRLAMADWIPLGDEKAPYARAIFTAIGAASLISEATSYSDRTDLFQVLSAPTVGHVLRRIEQKNDGQVAPYHLPALKQLEEVLA